MLAPVPLALMMAGCDVLRMGALNPAGPIAASQRDLAVIVGIVLLFVATPVLVLTPLIAWHYRLANKRHGYRPAWNFSWWLEALIWLPPTAIVIGLSIVLWHYTHRLDPYRPIAGTTPIEIEAVALDWKWLFIYPGDRLASVDRMTIPVGVPIRLRLTSGTVMQSILIPRLAGQIYAMAGMRTELNLMADRPGVYRGANVQFNGRGFAHQRFAVVALPRAQYDQWIGNVRHHARPLTRPGYDRLAQRSVLPRPMYFSAVPDDLFASVMARAQAAGASR